MGGGGDSETLEGLFIFLLCIHPTCTSFSAKHVPRIDHENIHFSAVHMHRDC